ncbi:MAG: TlpA family protein disulfide reductase [Myxococcota bacterium]
MMRRGALSFLCAALLMACGGSTKPAAPSLHRPVGEPAEFAFGVLDGSVVTSENTRGRVTALLFATSYDLVSQLVARRLDEVYRVRKPRFNAACIALEAAQNAVLVETFRDTLELKYPVAIADRVELRSFPAFANIDRVPMLVLLDRRGRERLRVFGPFENKQLLEWLSAAEE